MVLLLLLLLAHSPRPLRYKHRSLRHFLDTYLFAERAGRPPFVFDCYAGCGGYWSSRGSLVRVGTFGVVLEAALAGGALLSNVYAAERVTSMHRVLQKLAEARVAASGEDVAAARRWASGNVRCGPWGRELLPAARAALADGTNDVFLLCDQFGFTGVGARLLRTVFAAPARSHVLLFVSLTRVDEATLRSTFELDGGGGGGGGPSKGAGIERQLGIVARVREGLAALPGVGGVAHGLVFREALELSEDGRHAAGALAYALLFVSSCARAAEAMETGFRDNADTAYPAEARAAALGTANVYCPRGGM